MSDTEQMPSDREVDRPLTDEERALALWMLQNGSPEASAFIPQLENARVAAECPCGCPAVTFRIEGRPLENGWENILGNFAFDFGEDECEIYIYEQAGTLSGFEIPPSASQPIIKLPAIDELRQFPEQ